MFKRTGKRGQPSRRERTGETSEDKRQPADASKKELAQQVAEQGRALEELRSRLAAETLELRAQVRELGARVESAEGRAGPPAAAQEESSAEPEDESVVAARAARAIRLRDLHEQREVTPDEDHPSREGAGVDGVRSKRRARPKRDARRADGQGRETPKRRGKKKRAQARPDGDQTND